MSSARARPWGRHHVRAGDGVRQGQGLIRDRTYCIRLSDAKTVEGALGESRVSDGQGHGDFSLLRSGGDYGLMNTRSSAVGRKGIRWEGPMMCREADEEEQSFSNL